jgi:nucleoside-diphosphate-sugar epimerase
MQIDTTSPVMVTGATGYVAGWIVKGLLDAGLTVHAPVRNPQNLGKVQHLLKMAENSPGTLKLFKADLLDEGSYAEAMQGCATVFHTASPFTVNVKDPQTQLIDPAVKGTRNVLAEASRTDSVKRVVLTSSCAAIYTDAIDCATAPNGTLTEDIWNTTASLDYQPYSYSKLLAEKAAWEVANAQSQWDLVVVNPSLVIGPATNQAPTSESFNIVRQIGDGTMKAGAPRAEPMPPCGCGSARMGEFPAPTPACILQPASAQANAPLTTRGKPHGRSARKVPDLDQGHLGRGVAGRAACAGRGQKGRNQPENARAGQDDPGRASGRGARAECAQG